LSGPVDRQDLARWIARYEHAWRTPGTALLDDLFADDATYLAAPFDPLLRGRAEIEPFWDAERVSADEEFALTWEPVAVEGSVGVARVEVRYGEPVSRVYRDLWIVTLGDDGRCTAFEEWPFFPGQARTAI
jgi:ketosteroid isomerase-like protein